MDNKNVNETVGVANLELMPDVHKLKQLLTDLLAVIEKYDQQDN